MVSLNTSKHFPLKFVPVGFCCWYPRPLTDGVPCSYECLLVLASLKEVDSLFAGSGRARGNKLDGAVSGSNEYFRI